MNDLPRLDKSKIIVASLDDSREEDEYWHSKTPQERFEAIEIQRRLVYGEDQVTQRLPRLIEIVELDRS